MSQGRKGGKEPEIPGSSSAARCLHREDTWAGPRAQTPRPTRQHLRARACMLVAFTGGLCWWRGGGVGLQARQAWWGARPPPVCGWVRRAQGAMAVRRTYPRVGGSSGGGRACWHAPLSAGAGAHLIPVCTLLNTPSHACIVHLRPNSKDSASHPTAAPVPLATQAQGRIIPLLLNIGTKDSTIHTNYLGPHRCTATSPP